MSINEDLVVLEIDQNKIATITFNNPKSLNALSRDVLKNFKQKLNLVADDKNILGLVLIGEGEKAFIAGADIKEMLDMNIEDAQKFSLLGQEVTLIMENLEIPVIACVNGFALGGGLEMALGADFIYCSKNAVFGLPEVKLGLIPGFGGTQRLARVVGRNIAKELVYSGRNIMAEEALQMSLVNKIFENKTDLLNGAKDFLVKTQKNSIFAIGQAKKALVNGIDLIVSEGLKGESDIFASLFDSHDAKEGTKAFAEKRTANFRHLKGE